VFFYTAFYSIIHHLTPAGKISDAMSFGGGQAVPESWSVYRMIHLVDAGGIQVDATRYWDHVSKAAALLWSWVFLYKMLPQVGWF